MSAYYGDKKVEKLVLGNEYYYPQQPQPPEVEWKDVNFMDCDGRNLYSYTSAEALQLDEMPPLPTREGLSCTGWNCSLQTMKSEVSAVGVSLVGATYTTDDGSTRMEIELTDPKWCNVTIRFYVNSGGVVLDWGDGQSESVTGRGNKVITHAYSTSGLPYTKTISIAPTTATTTFYFNKPVFTEYSSASTTSPLWVEQGVLKRLHAGNGLTQITNYAFYCCFFLEMVTLPKGCAILSQHVFDSSRSLQYIVLPNENETVQNYTFSNCGLLRASFHGPLNNNAFFACPKLKSVILPKSFTPNQQVGSCNNLEEVYVGFTMAYSSYPVFPNAGMLRKVVLPSATGLPPSFVGGCWNLTSMQFPSNLNRIGANAFQNCYGFATFDFRRCAQVPTLDNVNAFVNTSNVKEIIVPDSLYDTWKAANNWNSTTNNIVDSIVKASESSLGSL